MPRLDGEQGGEGPGEHAEKDEPAADGDEDEPAPAFDCRCVGLDPIDEALPRGGHAEGSAEQQQDQDGRGDGEGCPGGGEPADGQGLPGQTGQDWSRSAEPCGQVAKAEQRRPHHGSAPS